MGRRLLILVLLFGGCEAPQPTHLGLIAPSLSPTRTCNSHQITFVSWNIRGYPENNQADTCWAHCQIERMGADVVCIQEIGSAARVQAFQAAEPRLSQAAFRDTPDAMDNAIFTTSAVTLKDLPDPEGFQHPAQAAEVITENFDAVVVTVHLSWTDVARRNREMAGLRQVVADAKRRDPDVIVVGDFNLKQAEVETLAENIGLFVMVPAGQENVGTTQAGNQYDHFLISDHLKRLAIGCHIQTFCGQDAVISKRVSDHPPIMAVFRTRG